VQCVAQRRVSYYLKIANTTSRIAETVTKIDGRHHTPFEPTMPGHSSGSGESSSSSSDSSSGSESEKDQDSEVEQKRKVRADKQWHASRSKKRQRRSQSRKDRGKLPNMYSASSIKY
jgi:hypothetical protein